MTQKLRFPLDQLETHCATRKKGFCDEVRKRAEYEGADIIIQFSDWVELTRKHRIPHPPSYIASDEPTIAELASNFAGAIARWSSDGFPVVTAGQYKDRAAACETCEHWDGSARLGLGKCKAPGCGCTKLKRWLATEKCPLAKWP